ncbi:MAG: N-acetyltransferase [Myxococcales bacterium]|nr:N-acetyltransferase [Myxococcales bacterium]
MERIRPGAAADLPDVVEIINHYVAHTAITFDVVPFTVETRRPWFEQFGPSGRHRLFVAEQSGRVVGWACSGPFRSKAAYETTAETAVYLAPDAVGQGLGSRLYAQLFEALAGEDLHRLVAGVTLPNERSIRLHERMGFERVGVFTGVGRKFDRYHDVAWHERQARGAPAAG